MLYIVFFVGQPNLIEKMFSVMTVLKLSSNSIRTLSSINTINGLIYLNLITLTKFYRWSEHAECVH